MSEKYSVKITKSSREFDARTRVGMKDLTSAIKFDTIVTEDNSINITPVDWAILEITNPKAEKDSYEVYVIVADDGKRYYTSSLAFWSSFMDIYTEMDGESFSIEVYKCESNNYKGKFFITCSIVW